ncbi:LCP family protein [Candidatus Dojkabacteria bacterium]|nr:LCP family protein [Candidatus Dojkabacteria bacterium]
MVTRRVNLNSDKPANKADMARRSRIEDLKKANGRNERKLKFRKYLKIFILLAILGLMAYGGYLGYQRWERLQEFNQSKTINNPTAQVCDNILNPSCWGQALAPQLNQYNGKTGVLIVGLDTREDSGFAAGTMNTDSIMAAVYNHETKKTKLISLPRDLYVPYKINGSGPYYSKINAIYATGEARDDVDDGFDLLQSAVENILGEKIQYRVVIRLKGVEDAVDAIGGVEVDIPKHCKIQYPNDYPGQDGKPNTTWLYYEFQPGVQKLDGEHALVWSRFRHVINNDCIEMASDFSRAERQQQVLDAVKDKTLAMEGSTLDKAENYWNIFTSLSKNISANIGLEEIFAGLSLMNTADRDPVNIVLDPNFGGLNQIIYHPPTTETGGYQIRFKDDTMTALHNYLDLIDEYPKLYDENAKILIENRTGLYYKNGDLPIEFRDAVQGNELPLTTNQLTMITSAKDTKGSGFVIIDFSKGEKSGTAKYLADYFGAARVIENPETFGFTKTNYKEDIRVIVYPASATN